MKKTFKIVLTIGIVLFTALIILPMPEQIKISDYIKSDGW